MELDGQEGGENNEEEMKADAVGEGGFIMDLDGQKGGESNEEEMKVDAVGEEKTGVGEEKVETDEGGGGNGNWRYM